MSTITVGRRRKFGAVKLGVATAAAVGLTLAGTAPVHAADYQLGPEDVIGFENGDEDSAGYNYDQWHIGSVYSTGADVEASLTFNECSVTTLAVPDDSAGATVTQVLKGFAIDERPSSAAEAEALINSISIDVVSGSVTLQLPMFITYEGADAPRFTTVRNAEPFTAEGTHSLTESTMLTDSRSEVADMTVAEFFTAYENEDEWGTFSEILGVGFTGSEGAEVNSISFGGDTFFFGTGDCLDEADEEAEDDVEDDEADDEPISAPRPPERVDTGR